MRAMTRDDIFDGVRECLAAVLDIPAEPIGPDDRIVTDLGADSLDLLDLTFQLEQEFKVKISPREIERRSRKQLGETPLEVDGVYTPEALMELRKALPEVPADELDDGLSVGELPRRFRVATMVNLVCRLLEEKDE